MALVIGFTMALAVLLPGQPAQAALATEPAASKLWVEFQPMPDGVDRPLWREAGPETRTRLQNQDLTITVTNAANNTAVAPYSGQQSATFTVTVSSATQPVANLEVRDTASDVEAYTNASGQALLTIPLDDPRVERFMVRDSYGQEHYAWYAVIDPDTALIQLSITDAAGAPIMGRDVQFIAGRPGSEEWVSENLREGETYVWIGMPASEPLELVGSASRWDEQPTYDYYVLRRSVTPQPYSASGIQQVVLDGTAATTVPVTTRLDGARTNAYVMVAPADTNAYRLWGNGAFTDLETAATLHVTPGAYDVRYHLPEEGVLAFGQLTVGATASPLNANLSTAQMADLNLELLMKPELYLRYGVLVVAKGKLNAWVPPGPLKVTPGTVQVTDTQVGIGNGEADWYYAFLTAPERQSLTLTTGTTTSLSVPLNLVGETEPAHAMPDRWGIVWFDAHNTAGDWLYSAKDDRTGSIALSRVELIDEQGRAVRTIDASIYGFWFAPPPSPSQQIWLYRGVFDVGPIAPATQVAGLIAVGGAPYATANPPMVKAFLSTDVTVTAPAGSSTVRLGGGATQPVSPTGTAQFTGVSVPNAQPIVVDGLHKGMLQTYDGRNAMVRLNAPEAVQRGGQFSAQVEVNDALNLYGAQVDLKVDPAQVRIVSATPGTAFASRTLWTLGPTISTDGAQLRYAVSLLGNDQPVAGSGSLLDLQFELIGDARWIDLGQFLEVKLSDPYGNPIPLGIKAPIIDVGAIVDGRLTSLGSPLSQAWVSLYDAATGRIVSDTQTDATGAYTLLAAADGEYLVAVHEWPFLPVAYRVQVVNDVADVRNREIPLVFGDTVGDDGRITWDDVDYMAEFYGDEYDLVDIVPDGRIDLQDMYHAAVNVGQQADQANIITWVTGTVTQWDGLPAVGARVDLYTEQGAQVTSAYTDAEGNYMLRGSYGTYRLSIAHSGHATVSVPMALYPFDLAYVDARLPLPPVALQTPMVITLSWDNTDTDEGADLDAELALPGELTVSDSDENWVYWDNTGSQTHYPWAVHSGDNSGVVGSEVITMSQIIPGNYYYQVNRFSGSIANATITVTRGNLPPVSFSAAESGVTDDWLVFKLSVGPDGSYSIIPVPPNSTTQMQVKSPDRERGSK